MTDEFSSAGSSKQRTQGSMFIETFVCSMTKNLCKMLEIYVLENYGDSHTRGQENALVQLKFNLMKSSLHNSVIQIRGSSTG